MSEFDDIPSRKCIFRISLDKERGKSPDIPPGFEEAGCHLCGGYLFSCRFYTPFSKMLDLGLTAKDFDSNGAVRPGNHKPDVGDSA
jgi:hypothetical protein